LVDGHKHFEEPAALMFRVEDGRNNFLRNISMYLLNDVTSHPNTTILSNPFRTGNGVHLHLSVKVKKYQLYVCLVMNIEKIKASHLHSSSNY